MTVTGEIRTTHTGSLPLLPEQDRLGELLTARGLGNQFDPGEFAELAAEAVDEAVGRQAGIGIDVISSGEVDRCGFMDASRLTGFDGPPTTEFRPRDLAEAGVLDWFLHNSGAVLPRMNTGPVRHNPEPIAAELDRFLAALDHHGVDRSRAFLPSPSPGVLASQGGSTYYTDSREFLGDIAAALREEYRKITASGISVQIDAPDLVMDWFVGHEGQTLSEFLDRMRIKVDAINEATDGIPAERKRVHVCHGNWPGPHHHDITLPEVIDVLYALDAGTLVLEMANPRHRWERRVFGPGEHPLPDGKSLAAGVVDSCSQSVEHPLTVAADLIEIASFTGPGRVVFATPDCGFRTMAGLGVPPGLTEMKLRSLVEGTRLANEQLSQRQAEPVS